VQCDNVRAALEWSFSEGGDRECGCGCPYQTGFSRASLEPFILAVAMDRSTELIDWAFH
jgi:hypothetical protein